MSATDHLTPQDLLRYTGDSAALSISLVNPDTGAALTLTGKKLLFTVKLSPDDADSAARCAKDTLTGGMTLANPTVVTLVPDDFADGFLEAGVVYSWDVKAVTIDTGARQTVAKGTLWFESVITQGTELEIETHTEQPGAIADYAAEASTAAAAASSAAAEISATVSIEASTRTSADASLASLISTEESARASADTSLAARLSTEESVTTAADSSLTTRVSTEESTRTSADASLTTRISSEEVARASAVSAETSSRVSADASLATSISTELSTRASADTSLTTRVSTEDFTRTSADASLTTRISAEESARTAGDSSLTTALSSETSSRVSGDASLASSISTEQSARASADTSLTTRVSTEESTRTSADASLTTRISNEEVARSTAVSAETSSRVSGDASLATSISTEQSTRASADTSLTTRVSTEESTRTSADASLTTRISSEEVARSTAVSAETSSRVSGDASLTTRLSTEESTRLSADTSLTTRVSTEESTRTAAGLSLTAQRNPLAPAGGVAFDGTASQRINSTLTNQTLATDDFSIGGFLVVPSSNPSAIRGLWALASSATDGTQANAAVGYIDTSSNYRSRIYGSTTSDYNEIYLSLSAWAGKVIHLAQTRSGSTVTLYVNGAAQAVSTASAGTPPTWAGSITSTYFNVGFLASATPFVGSISRWSLYNLALSAAEILEIFEAAGVVPWRYQWGSQVALSSGSTGALTNQQNIADASVTVPAGISVRMVVSVVGFSGNSPNRCFLWNPNANTVVSNIVDLGISAGSGTYTAIFTPWTAATGYRIGTNHSSVQFSLTSSSYAVYRLGALVYLPLDDGLGYQLQDLGTNRLHALMTTSGISHLLPSYGPARLRATSNTNGNQQLLGATALPGACQILRVRARSQSGTPTVTLGTASGGAQVVASVALSTTWKDLTIALTGGINSSAASLWAGSNATNVVEWDLTWEPLSA